MINDFFINNILKIIEYIDIGVIYNFILDNKYIYLFIIITNIIMIFDFRFTYIVKLLVIPLFVITITIVLTIIDVNNFGLWLLDLFWYTKILNLSFIIHTCWFNWIYIFFWYYRYERVCWVVSRISFICSLSFVLCLINYFHFYINETIYYKYRKIIENSNKLKFIYMYIIIICYIIKTIIRFFMMIHGNYSILFMKNSEFSYAKLISLVKIFLFISSTFFLSYFIFGICRLYIVWILLFIYEFIKLFQNYLKDYDLKYKNMEVYIYWNICKKYKWLNKYIQFFTVYIYFNYSKDIELKSQNNVIFLYTYIYKYLLTYPQNKYLYINCYKNNFDYANFCEPYKFLFKNRESWLKLCKHNLDIELWCCDNLEKADKMLIFINDMEKTYNLTELEKQSFIKFYTIDDEKRFRKVGRELGYTEKQINKFWRGENPYN